MVRSPLVRGLLIGLFIGFVVGYLSQRQPPAVSTAESGEVEKLRHQIESMRRERDGLERNLAEFQRVAERMTEAFGVLEERFKRLEGRLADAPPTSAAPE